MKWLCPFPPVFLHHGRWKPPPQTLSAWLLPTQTFRSSFAGSHLAKTLLVPGFPNAHQQVEGRLYGYSEISVRAGRGSGLYVVVTSFLLFTSGSLFRSPFAVREQNARAPSTCWSASLLTPPPAHLKIKCYRQLGCWGLPSGSDLDIFKWITWKGHLFLCLLPPSEDLEDIYFLRHN